METKLNELSLQNGILEKTIASQKLELTRYKNEMRDKIEELNQLRTDSKCMESRVTKLDLEYDVLQNIHKQLQEQLETKKNEFSKLTENLNELNVNFKNTVDKYNEEIVGK